MLRVLYVLLFLLVPNISHAWWSEEWAYRMPIAVTYPPAESGAHSAASSADDNIFLIKIHAGNFPDFFMLQENLADLRFIAGDDKTPLNFQVDSFDLVNQLLFVWVNIPNSTAENPEKIWMYYGNSKAVAAAEAANVFDANQAAVFHFHSVDPKVADGTAYKNQVSLTAGEVTSASLIGSGLKLNGDAQLLLQDSPSIKFDSSKGITFSAWVKPSSFDGQAMSLLSRVDANGNSIDIYADATDVLIQLNNSGKILKVKSGKALEVAKWTHLGVVIDSEKIHIYLDGQQVKVEPLSVFSLAGPINIGGKSSVATGFKGEMDEIRLANNSISQKSLAIAVKNQGIVDEIVAAQAPEQLGSESHGDTTASLIAVIFQNMDELGWIVLSIMGVMSLISIFVMAAKAMYLRRVRKDNLAFLKAYEKLLERDPTVLDKDSDDDENFSDAPIMQAVFGNHDHFQSSTIYHLYHRGIHEIKGRERTIQASGLTTRATNALRAAIDAQLVREVQRLNSLMVLLTIAISGGPFIGLFGTVMGVMMTFAAIAKTGDVNIAAIAPGVAAALLTTLGGLFVAIPALFGYNYLSSRIKESIADMRVFSDEFVTRLAEYYGRS